MATLTELLSILSPENHVKGSQFERICKWYLEHDPKYKYELDKVWLWREWPDRWGPDCGIDLVARAYDGKLWAIQSKAYDEQYAIKKADIDTFLSESSRSVFSFRLLIASTNLIGHTANKTVQAQEKKVGLMMLSDLMKSEIDWPQTPDHLVANRPARKTPRPHQEKAIEDVLAGFSKNNRGQLIMACGTGKTLVSLWAAEKLKSKRTLVLLPSLSLLAQCLREWVINAHHQFHYLPVCSDDTVRGEDHFTSHTSEIGLPVTTDPDVVAEFLRRDENLIIFSTYQSSPVIAKVFARHDIPAFDLAIADEAHRCTGSVSSNFATILDESAIKSKRRLFMTATPRYFTDKAYQEADEIEYEIASMDDADKFGTIMHKLNFSDAIEQELLSDYKVVVIGVDNYTYKKYAEDERSVTFGGSVVTDAKTLASQIALCKAMRQYDLKRVISFHGRINRAKEFSQKFPGVIYWMPPELRPEGKIWSSYVSGQMTSGQRSLRIDRLRYIEENERGLISNARCLGEGVDVPALDGVAFIDPRHSQTDIIQAVGRAIRKSQNKKHGVIILPVFIGDSEDPEFALKGSAFKPVWDVLKALRAHDDVLAEELDSLCRKLGANKNPDAISPAKISLNLSVSVSEDFAKAFRVMIVRKSTSSWEYGYGQLLAYIDAKGDSLVPKKYETAKGYKLGSWVASQRASYKKNSLPKKRQIALEQLPEWVWDYSLGSWKKKLKYLKEYVKREMSADVPINYFTEDGFNLGTWVKYQHLAHNSGNLSKEMEESLEEINGWAWKTDNSGNLSKEMEESQEETNGWPCKTEFQDFLKFPHILIKKLELYTAMYDSNVAIKFITADGLGDWISEVRRAYSQGRLSRENIKAFENVSGWVWSPAQLPREPEPHNVGGKGQSQYISSSHEHKWQVKYKCLQKYILEHKTSSVPCRHVTADGINLGLWVATQRTQYKSRTLSKKRQRLLEQLPGWEWSSQEHVWNTGYLSAQQYAKDNGDLLISFDYITEDGFKLGQWVTTQRTQYNSRTLSKKRQRLLEQLPGWQWDGHRYKWQEGFEHLQEYAQKHGNCKVAQLYHTADGFHLGLWCSSQKEAYLREKLSTDRQKRLEALPGWEWRKATKKKPKKRNKATKSRMSWLKKFKCLEGFVKENGHANVPREYVLESGFALGNWVGTQRYYYKYGRLAKVRQETLESIPEWTWVRRQVLQDDNMKTSVKLVADVWLNSLKQLLRYAEENGNCNVPFDYITSEGYRLGRWVTDQRYYYNRGARKGLNEEQIALLEKIPGWTWTSNRRQGISWQEAYSKLLEYCQKEGHARVHQHYKTEDGYGLGNWVGTQRRFYKKGKLSKKKQQLLESLPGWEWVGTTHSHKSQDK